MSWWWHQRPTRAVKDARAARTAGWAACKTPSCARRAQLARGAVVCASAMAVILMSVWARVVAITATYRTRFDVLRAPLMPLQS